MGYSGEPFKVCDLAGGVSDNLRVDCLGVLGQRRLVVCGVGAFHEGGFDAEPAQGDIQLGDCSAVQLGGCHNMVACLAERGEGDELGGHAGCGRHRPNTAL